VRGGLAIIQAKRYSKVMPYESVTALAGSRCPPVCFRPSAACRIVACVRGGTNGKA
jgi:hypothetical protein